MWCIVPLAAALMAAVEIFVPGIAAASVPAGTLVDLIATNPDFSLTTAAFSNASIVGDTLYTFYRSRTVTYTIFVANDAAWEETARLVGLPNGHALLDDPRLPGVMSSQVLCQSTLAVAWL